MPIPGRPGEVAPSAPALPAAGQPGPAPAGEPTTEAETEAAPAAEAAPAEPVKTVEEWLAELDEMRDRMRWVRDTLAAAGQVGPIAMSVLGTQNGLFSMLPLSSEQILAIRERHGVYMAGTGRINIAGLTTGNIERFIEALRDVAKA